MLQTLSDMLRESSVSSLHSQPCCSNQDFVTWSQPNRNYGKPAIALPLYCRIGASKRAIGSSSAAPTVHNGYSDFSDVSGRVP